MGPDRRTGPPPHPTAPRQTLDWRSGHDRRTATTDRRRAEHGGTVAHFLAEETVLVLIALAVLVVVLERLAY